MSNFLTGKDDQIPETRTIDVASELSPMLRSVLDYAGAHGARFDEIPLTDSPADLEMRNAAGTLSEQRRLDIQATHQNAAGICIRSSGYLLFALAQLYQPDMALFGFQVIARAIVESSMKAWWLVDPTASIDTRLARLYVDNLTNINEMTKVGRLNSDDAESVDMRREMLVERAESAGVPPLYNRKGKLIGFGEVDSPTSTETAGKFFAALGYELGEFWYRSLSAICHGTAYGLLDHYTVVDIPNSDFQTLAPQLSIEDVIHIAVLSMQAHLGAIQFHSMYLGWDHEDVESKRREFQQRMLSVRPT